MTGPGKERNNQVQGKRWPKIAFFVLIIGSILYIGFRWFQLQEQEEGLRRGAREALPAPVEAVEIEHGPISLQRTFSGELEAQAEFVVAPKVGGRIEQLTVNLSDTVKNGQIVAELDNDEYVMAVAQAGADLAVANANLVEARNALEIANREFERTESLRNRRVASESQYDEAIANLSAKQARLEVAKAQVARAEALLNTANIRLGYTSVTANWTGDASPRVVAERYIDEGQTVSANDGLILIVDLDPIIGVVFVTEKDFGRMKPGRTAYLTTAAYPGETFEGRIERISPVFQQSTRQARVELIVGNPTFRLKPGMFIRATVELDHIADAAVVLDGAITERDDRPGVFLIDEDRMTVSWRSVKVGIREGGRIQIIGENLSGRVVSLGHQLVDDGSAVVVSRPPAKTISGGEDPGSP